MYNRKLRKVDDDDVINSVIAGAIAGAVASMYTRNPRKMLTNGEIGLTVLIHRI